VSDVVAGVVPAGTLSVPLLQVQVFGVVGAVVDVGSGTSVAAVVGVAPGPVEVVVSGVPSTSNGR